ncbi:CBS domain-containing protein [Streptomyces sp. NBC_01262]|uniref:CBS domain-containing protein n=1 Tax=Streptomyces sp. NBC_01262 TaxID=2903803 RepID=UPI003FCDA849
MLRRYLGAVAAVSSAQAGQEPHRPKEPPPRRQGRPAAVAPHVRDVMSVPAVSAPGDMPFLEIVRKLSREHLSAVPVVDADDQVIGVVSESDLLARAAVHAATPRPGPIRRIREHHLYDKSHGESASTLMTSPAITVRSGTPVAGSTWCATTRRSARRSTTWSRSPTISRRSDQGRWHR